MLTRTRWRVVEEPCRPADAGARWGAARELGAVGAVTSWGAGIVNRDSIRLYWELDGDARVPEGEDLVEENWTSHWRQSFRTTAVTRNITLVPAWETPPMGDGHILRLDPGMAFGAGDHPTTRLCLELLEGATHSHRPPSRFLDVGAGTGVLALAAACLGTGQADALDIDPFGYAACRRNALLNGLEGAVRPVLLSIDLLDLRYPLVAANIVAGQLRHLAQLLQRTLDPGGALILSGFEQPAEARVIEAVGWPLLERRSESGWVALMLQAPGGE